MHPRSCTTASLFCPSQACQIRFRSPLKEEDVGLGVGPGIHAGVFGWRKLSCYECGVELRKCEGCGHFNTCELPKDTGSSTPQGDDGSDAIANCLAERKWGDTQASGRAIQGYSSSQCPFCGFLSISGAICPLFCERESGLFSFREVCQIQVSINQAGYLKRRREEYEMLRAKVIANAEKDTQTPKTGEKRKAEGGDDTADSKRFCVGTTTEKAQRQTRKAEKSDATGDLLVDIESLMMARRSELLYLEKGEHWDMSGPFGPLASSAPLHSSDIVTLRHLCAPDDMALKLMDELEKFLTDRPALQEARTQRNRVFATRSMTMGALSDVQSTSTPAVAESLKFLASVLTIEHEAKSLVQDSHCQKYLEILVRLNEELNDTYHTISRLMKKGHAMPWVQSSQPAENRLGISTLEESMASSVKKALLLRTAYKTVASAVL